MCPFKIGLSSLSIFYYWNNISAKKNNHKFQYVWNGVTFTLTIPDGQYEYSSLNKFLQFEFIKNNHYLINSNGDYVYFAEFLLNTTEGITNDEGRKEGRIRKEGRTRGAMLTLDSADPI